MPNDAEVIHRAGSVRAMTGLTAQDQEVQGPLLARSPEHANTWMPLLHTGLPPAFAPSDVLPARTADAYATLLATTQTQNGSTSPWLACWDGAAAPPLQKSRQRMTVANRNAT
jgi:hypothetical protein